MGIAMRSSAIRIQAATRPKVLPGMGRDWLLAMGVVVTNTTFPPGFSAAWGAPTSTIS